MARKLIFRAAEQEAPAANEARRWLLNRATAIAGEANVNGANDE